MVQSAKQVTSAVAPFWMSMSMAGLGVTASLWMVTIVGLSGAMAFAFITLSNYGQRTLKIATEHE